MQWYQLDHMRTICTSLQTDNHINTPSLIFYRPDALPDAKALKATSTGGNSTCKHNKMHIHRVPKNPQEKNTGGIFGTAYKYTKMSHNIIRIYPAVHLRNDHSNYHKRYVLITNAAKLWQNGRHVNVPAIVGV